MEVKPANCYSCVSTSAISLLINYIISLTEMRKSYFHVTSKNHRWNVCLMKILKSTEKVIVCSYNLDEENFKKYRLCNFSNLHNGFVWKPCVWPRGAVVITTAWHYSAKPELRFCAGSNPARVVAEICDGEDLLTKERKQPLVVILHQATFHNISILCLWLKIKTRTDQVV